MDRWLEKANMILTTREATEKDRSLKTLLLIQTGNCSEEKNKWKESMEERWSLL